MKTGSRILIGVAVAAVVVAIAIVVVRRVLVSNEVIVPLAGSTQAPPPGTKTISYDLAGFSGVAASGAWQLSLREGPRYAVSVAAPTGMADRLQVRKQGTMLLIGFAGGATLTPLPVAAEITMPVLTALKLSGVNRATFAGFSGRRLDLECTGAAEIRGGAGSYEQVAITASGASSVRLRELPVVSAEAELSGAASAELTMKGGTLGGRLSGAAKVTYWGEASAETLKTSGVAAVSHR